MIDPIALSGTVQYNSGAGLDATGPLFVSLAFVK